MWAIVLTIGEKHVKTWMDFPDFYNNPVIKRLAVNQKWTISSTKSPDPEKPKEKVPMDMHILLTEGYGWGASFTRGYNPLVDLNTLCQAIPNAINNCYYLDSEVDGIVVLDVEPKCPESLKKQFMELPWLYAETSMSGKGLHLIFERPDDLLSKYPNAREKQSLQDSNGYYEILMNHMVTFTRNALPHPNETLDIDVFHNIFEILAVNAKPTIVSGKTVIVDEIDTDSIPWHDEITSEALEYTYKKTLQDFPKKGTPTECDPSAYEFGMSSFYHYVIRRIISSNPKYNEHDYTDEEKAVMIYTCTSSILDARPKHNERRNGMPWLLSVASKAIEKNYNTEWESKRKTQV